MAQSEKYKSFPIPERSVPEQPQTETEKPPAISSAQLHADPFVEIAMQYPGKLQTAASIPAPQPIDAATEQRRVQFYNMRQIAYDQFAFDSDYARAKVFYQQAKYMEAFEDDDPQQVNFSSDCPDYQKMSYQQLRTYFTWRTQVRQGRVEQVALPYAFLYVYELLNHIGVKDPEEGLEKLLFFWRTFQKYDVRMDPFVLRWLKDYHVYYPLSHSFAEFAEEHDLTMHYPAVFGHDADKENRFALYAEISKYKILKSNFYSAETAALIQNCFCDLFAQLQQRFREKGAQFESLIFYQAAVTSAWVPFSKALFYPVLDQADRQVVLSAHEMYECSYNRWTFRTTMLSENGKQLISYIMKEMEASLRQILNYKRRLVAKPDMCDEKTRSTLAKQGILFPAYIRKCVGDYYARSNRKEVIVHPGNLSQIRREALQTQERLIVPEEETVFALETTGKAAALQAAPRQTDSWTMLKEALSGTELETLKLALSGGNVKAVAVSENVMLEVLLDGINDKAMDCVGDALLEFDGTVVIYDDYKEKLMEMVNTDGK